MNDEQQRARGAHIAVLHELRSRYTESGSPARRAALGAAIDALSAAPEGQPIETAPHDGRVLVRCESGGVYAAHWVQNSETGDEAWLVCALEDGTQMLAHPIEWMPLPATARPQGVKDAT